MTIKKFISRLAIITLLIWAVVLIIAGDNKAFLPLLIIAFSLGLRHGFDVDHIVAIDNVTRKLAFDNKRSFTTGLFFALGHSTIVFILTLLIVAGVVNFQGNLGLAGDYGGIVGTLVSSIFLIMTGFMNLKALSGLKQPGHAHSLPGGVMSFLMKRVFNLVDRPAKMYIVGFLFGLGFDTATEIALLGIAAGSALNGFAIWNILLLPIMFASGMIITDSVDSIFMTRLYNWVQADRQKLINYNRIILTIAVIMSFVVGGSELLGLATQYFSLPQLINHLTSLLDEYSEQVGILVVVVFFGIWISVRQRKLIE